MAGAVPGDPAVLSLFTRRADQADRSLSAALEDYVETIFRLQGQTSTVRIRDIAAARDVRPSRASAALRQLDARGLIRHDPHGPISLTPAGLQEARRIRARHEALMLLFRQVLGLPDEEAEACACSMEHSLGRQGMDRLTRFLEFITVCPQGQSAIRTFRQCDLGSGEQRGCTRRCLPPHTEDCRHAPLSLADMSPGDLVAVRFVAGRGAVRQRLLDMGILPGVAMAVERVAPAGGPVWVALHGYQLSLRRKEAQAILVTRSGSSA